MFVYAYRYGPVSHGLHRRRPRQVVDVAHVDVHTQLNKAFMYLCQLKMTDIAILYLMSYFILFAAKNVYCRKSALCDNTSR